MRVLLFCLGLFLVVTPAFANVSSCSMKQREKMESTWEALENAFQATKPNEETLRRHKFDTAFIVIDMQRNNYEENPKTDCYFMQEFINLYSPYPFFKDIVK